MHQHGSPFWPHSAGRRSPRYARTTILSSAALLLLGGTATSAESRSEPLPSFKEVRRVVARHFASLPDQEAADLITQKDVAPIFSNLREIGWLVEDRKEILSRVPAADDFVVKQLRTKKGRRFMRSVAKYPGAYDRLDRWSRIPKGKQAVKDLVRGTDGYKMIEYMTSTSGGKNLGKMLSKDRGGKDFNKPTGKIYTAQALMSELKASHTRAVEKRAKAAANTTPR